MKLIAMILVALFVSAFSQAQILAGPKSGGAAPPGLAKKSGVPPGLAKKGGLPPGIAKKYAVGDRLPATKYQPIGSDNRSKLPYDAPSGNEWVGVGDDLYLLATSTGTVVEIVENWLK